MEALIILDKVDHENQIIWIRYLEAIVASNAIADYPLTEQEVIDYANNNLAAPQYGDYSYYTVKKV